MITDRAHRAYLAHRTVLVAISAIVDCLEKVPGADLNALSLARRLAGALTIAIIRGEPVKRKPKKSRNAEPDYYVACYTPDGKRIVGLSAKGDEFPSHASEVHAFCLHPLDRER